MFYNIIPLLALQMQNVTICLETILAKGQVETVALVHLNTTVDVADTIYEQLANDADYAWMRFNMDDSDTLQNHLMQNNLINNMFFVYVLDHWNDWNRIYNFIIASKLNHREKQIYIVNQYPSLQVLARIGYLTFQRHFFNSAVMFWNSSGHGSGLEAYTFNGFLKNFIIKIPVINDRCSSNIYDQMFFEKVTNFHGQNWTIYGNAEPPRVVKTVAMVNGRYEYSIGGHDVLINDVIAKHLNATAQYKLVLALIYYVNANTYAIHLKPETNIEERVFNVSQIERYTWEVPDFTTGYIKTYTSSAVDMISQQMNYKLYFETLRYKDYTYLYPHDTDNFIIIVPRKLKSQTEYSHIFKSPLLLVWLPITIVSSIVRYIFKKMMNTDKKIMEIFVQTFGLSLGMSFREARTSAAEKLLLWWFCLGTMLSGMLLSSSMFQGFSLRMDIPTINNLQELEMSGLVIQLPLYTESVKNYFESLPVNLNLNYSMEYSISQMISDGNTSCAYVIRERKFHILFDDSNDKWHIVERFGIEHLSYKLRLNSGMEDRMNNIIQRCVEHGIVNYLVAKNKRILTGTRTTDHEIISNNVKPVPVSEIQNYLVLYCAGKLMSLIIFIVEVIFGNVISNELQLN